MVQQKADKMAEKKVIEMVATMGSHMVDAKADLWVSIAVEKKVGK
jgi:hypothetical protein